MHLRLGQHFYYTRNKDTNLWITFVDIIFEKNIIKHMPKPQPDIKMIKKVKILRNKGLSYRAIGKLLDKDHKSIWRWNKYDLSTVWLDNVGKKNIM